MSIYSKHHFKPSKKGIFSGSTDVSDIDIRPNFSYTISMRTYPNQKLIEIVKAPADKSHPYGILNDEAVARAAQELGGNAFKLYIYLATNQNGFLLALSKQDFMAWSGVQENTYRSAVKTLQEKGYLLHTGDHWTFLEQPVEEGEMFDWSGEF